MSASKKNRARPDVSPDCLEHWTIPAGVGGPISAMAPEQRMVDALVGQQVAEGSRGAFRLYADQVPLLARFAAAPLAEKRRMLGKYWPKWKKYVAERYSTDGTGTSANA